jgi:hypothetical protein
MTKKLMSACVTCDEFSEIKREKEHVESQLDSLARFLMEQYPNEIGKTEDPHGEGAVECAIRLLRHRLH